MSRPCRVELPVGFGNRWKTTRTVVASRNTGRGRSFGQVTDLLATPAGFEPATLSLEVGVMRVAASMSDGALLIPQRRKRLQHSSKSKDDAARRN